MIDNSMSDYDNHSGLPPPPLALAALSSLSSPVPSRPPAIAPVVLQETQKAMVRNKVSPILHSRQPETGDVPRFPLATGSLQLSPRSIHSSLHHTAPLASASRFVAPHGTFGVGLKVENKPPHCVISMEELDFMGPRAHVAIGDVLELVDGNPVSY